MAAQQERTTNGIKRKKRKVENYKCENTSKICSDWSVQLVLNSLQSCLTVPGLFVALAVSLEVVFGVYAREAGAGSQCDRGVPQVESNPNVLP